MFIYIYVYIYNMKLCVYLYNQLKMMSTGASFCSHIHCSKNFILGLSPLGSIGYFPQCLGLSNRSVGLLVHPCPRLGSRDSL